MMHVGDRTVERWKLQNKDKELEAENSDESLIIETESESSVLYSPPSWLSALSTMRLYPSMEIMGVLSLIATILLIIIIWMLSGDDKAT